MRRSAVLRFLALGALVAGAACSDSTGPAQGEVDSDLMAGILSASSAPGANGTFPCPAGGELERDGTFEVSHADEIATMDYQISLEFRSCAHTIQGNTITLDGHSDQSGRQRVRLPPGQPPQILEYTSHQSGSLRWRGPGLDRTCDIDAMTTFDPATRRFHVVGSICGRTVDVTFGENGPYQPEPPQGTGG